MPGKNDDQCIEKNLNQTMGYSLLEITLLLDYQVFLSDKNKGGGRVNR